MKYRENECEFNLFNLRKRLVLKALSKGNNEEAAKMLGINETCLYRYKKQFGIIGHTRIPKLKPNNKYGIEVPQN